MCEAHNKIKDQFCLEKKCSQLGCYLCLQNHNPEHQSSKKLPKSLLSRYQFSSRLGEGGFGVVFKVWSLSKKKFLALKIIYLQEMYDSLDNSEMEFLEFRKLIQREIIIHKELNHDNIIKYYDSYCLEDDKLYLIELELADTNLASCLKDLNTDEASDLFSQMCSAVEYLHRNDIIHRDLKPANILIVFSKDKKKTAKLGDFGGAKLETIYGTRQKNTLHGGSPPYNSPEIIKEESSFTQMSDIWALGIIFHEMLSQGIRPFTDKNEILKGKFKISLKIPKSKVSIIEGPILFILFPY